MSNDKLIKMEGFDGPFENKYLAGAAPGNHDKKFRTLKEAKEECLNNDFATGITYTRAGFYTLRKGKRLLNSDTHNRFKSKEITWVKDPTFIRIKNKIKVKNLFTKNDYIIEEIDVKKNYNPEDIYEKIFIKNKEYLYNIKKRIILDFEGQIVGELINGRIV